MSVDALAVTIYGNSVGWFPEGITIALDCSATKVANEIINPAVGGGQCRYAAGMVWANGAPDDVTVVSTVKMSTAEGFVWVKLSDYTAFITHCNACCIS